MPTLTKTRAMSHADALAALNATAKKAATKEAEKKKQDAANKKKAEEEQAIKIKEAREEKKKDAVRLTAGKAARTTQTIGKEPKKKEHASVEVNNHLMVLCQFNKDGNGDEREVTSKTLFDGEEGSDSPAHKRPKHSLGALKPQHRYTKPTTKKGSITLQQNTMYINFGVTLTTEDKSRKFASKVKDLLMNLQLLDFAKEQTPTKDNLTGDRHPH